jgi:hypothetical protein
MQVRKAVYNSLGKGSLAERLRRTVRWRVARGFCCSDPACCLAGTYDLAYRLHRSRDIFEFARALAPAHRVPKKLFFHAPPPPRPAAMDWQESLAQSGCLGVCLGEWPRKKLQCLWSWPSSAWGPVSDASTAAEASSSTSCFFSRCYGAIRQC